MSDTFEVKIVSGFAKTISLLFLKMNLTIGKCYHVYNRGNNRQPIFFSDDNYVFFLRKIRHFISPVAEIISWTLMPNHFHLLIYANENSVKTATRNGIEVQQFSEGIKGLLSSYTKAINKQNNRSGSLFQQKTKAKEIDLNSELQLMIAFHYIHQNPLKAGLVKRMEDWPFSSFRDYMNLRNGTICNKELANQMISLDLATFYNDSYAAISDEKIQLIY